MIPDWVLASILGSMLTLVASLTTLLLTNYMDIKQKDKDRIIDQTDNIIHDVYSPLFFYLYEITTSLAKLMSIFTVSGEFNFEKEVDSLIKELNLENSKENKDIISSKLSKGTKDYAIAKLKLYAIDFKVNSIKDLLLANMGSIKPSEFRVELFLYFQLLSGYETALAEFVSNDSFDPIKDKRWFESMNKVSQRLSEINISIIGYLNTVMRQKDLGNLQPDYKSLISWEECKKLNDLILLRVT